MTRCLSVPKMEQTCQVFELGSSRENMLDACLFGLRRSFAGKSFARKSIITLAAIMFFVCCPSPVSAIEAEEFQAAFQETLGYSPAKFLGIEGHGLDAESIDRELSRVYQENSLQPFWVTAKGPGKRAEEILKALVSAESHGLDPESYHLSKIEKYWQSMDADGLARLDILLSLGLAGYMADLREGDAEPKKLDPRLFATARDEKINPVELGEEAIQAEDMKAFLDDLVPPFNFYDDLREALSKYRSISANGGWETIPQGKTIKAGMEDSRIPLIQKRLAATGDLEVIDPAKLVYDDKVVLGVKNFQERHGIDVDGVIGPDTLSEMNVTVDARIRQILVNMERWRWVTREPGDWVIVVNIAGFTLGGIRNDRIEKTMPVIVGKEYHKTPVFSDTIKYIEFNPYWNVPPSIARNETLPKLQKDSLYLKKQNIRVFDGWGPDAKELDSTAIDWQQVSRKRMGQFRLRQDPGPKNALGTVKFMFPNDFNVYLHDTPSHGLFKKTKRAFSHGCIRVSRPSELASYLLGGEEKGWGLDRVKEVINSKKRTVVRLDSHVPVFITYRTVVVDPDSRKVHFRKDIYDRDALLAKALFE